MGQGAIATPSLGQVVFEIKMKFWLRKATKPWEGSKKLR